MSSSQEGSWNGQSLSGWWSRVGAQIIDGLVISLAWVIVIAFLGIILALSFSGPGDGAIVFAIFFFVFLAIGLSIVTMVLYYGLTMKRQGLKNGQTLGKEVLSITVKREGGQAIDFKYALFRQVAVIYSFFNVFVSIFTAGVGPVLNYLWPLWDDKRQALHDKMVGSRVVKL